MENFYKVINWEVDTGKKWIDGKPIDKPTKYGDVIFHELEWSYSRVAKIRNKKEVDKCVSFIVQLVETSKYKDEVKALLKKEDEMLRPKREKFEEQIRDLIRSIELGNIIKGKCKHCP